MLIYIYMFFIQACINIFFSTSNTILKYIKYNYDSIGDGGTLTVILTMSVINSFIHSIE